MEKPINENCSQCKRPNGTYRKQCPVCLANARANSRRWVAANIEKKRANDRAYFRKKYAENPYKYIDRSLAWAAANPEKVRAINRRWEAANPERVQAHKRLSRHNARMDKLSRGEYPRCPDGRRIWEMLTGIKLGRFAND